MSNVGVRIGVPPFYVAFVLAPLASEFIASYSYAAKKMAKTITVSLSALEGAAYMNNTFCLSIFMGLVYFKWLAWRYTAETVSILIAQLLVAVAALQRTLRVWHAFLVLLVFPLSILLVMFMEANGYD